MTDSLSLQNVVTGFAQVKGTKDIMSNISYFFELYDDDGDGRVDREGILRISEALLFLSRRGLNEISPAASTTDIQNGGGAEKSIRDEQFLSSVSAFIRRCFEYADPDHPSSQANKSLEETNKDLDNFAIGADDDDDLIDLSQPNSPADSKTEAINPVSAPPPDSGPLSPTSEENQRLEKAKAANLALDPNKPLHITLPTFRMVILADQVLEQFFEVGFSSSFRLSETQAVQTPSSSNLTTFSNAGKQMAAAAGGMGGVIGGAGAGVVPPGKGLRGMLDNIVSDGMRVAAEVRRRMDEAQKEMDREARQGRDDEDDEDEASNAKDADLLEGAETAGVDASKSTPEPSGLLAPGGSAGAGAEIKPGRNRSGSDASRKVVEFER
jgi:Sec-independent protein translocase protein TatA